MAGFQHAFFFQVGLFLGSQIVSHLELILTDVQLGVRTNDDGFARPVNVL